MKIVGRYSTVYECDTSKKTKDTDGTVYAVKNKDNCKIKILDKAYCTKAKEQEISQVMNGENSQWYGPSVIDMVYSHGKFAGYLYEEAMQYELPEETIIPEMPKEQKRSVPVRRNTGQTDILNSSAIRILYALAAGIILSVLTYSIFFQVYINLILSMYTPQMAGYCYTFNFSGITGIVGGIAAMAALARILYRGSQGVMYYMLLPVGYAAGMVAVFLLVTIIIILVKTAYSIFIAVIPTLIIIGGIILVGRSILKR